MNSNRIKLLIISLFSLIILFFIVNLSNIKNAKNFFSEQEINEAVNVLEKKGVLIDRNAVINEKKVPFTKKFEYDSFVIEAFAKTFMTQKYDTFTIPDGQKFAGHSESFSFFNDYTFEYSRDENIPDASEIVYLLDTNDLASDKLIKDAQNKLDKTFSGILSQSNSHLKVKNVIREGENTYISAIEYVDEIEINSTYILLILNNDDIIYSVGKIYLSKDVTDYKVDSFDSINILFKIEKSNVEIKNMEIIYYPVSNKKGSLYLTPTYKFTYSDGIIKLYDAASSVQR